MNVHILASCHRKDYVFHLRFSICEKEKDRNEDERKRKREKERKRESGRRIEKGERGEGETKKAKG